jgi:hypothetical protein
MKNIIKFSVPLAAGAFLLILAAAPEAKADESDKVTICHFSGHAGALIPDFVTRSTRDSGSNLLCAFFGGEPIEVSANACENGHAALPFNFPGLYPGEIYTCQDGGKQKQF